MPDDAVGWSIEMYRTARGTSPVEDFINGLPPEQQAKVYVQLSLLEELGTRLGMPHVKAVKGHQPMRELRPFPNRILYCAFEGRRFILLHAFEKRNGELTRGISRRPRDAGVNSWRGKNDQ
jgi:hypothetical protein